MDMSKFNEEIKNASDDPVDDGPRLPDGDYIMAVITHEDKPKGERLPDGSYPQEGLWVTHKVLEGEYKGKEFSKYYGLRHPTSKPCVRYGLSGLKNFYRSINFMPVEFAGVYGKRFVATLKSKKNPEGSDFAWSTDIVAYAKAPVPQGQSFGDAAAEQFNGQVLTEKQQIDEIPF